MIKRWTWPYSWVDWKFSLIIYIIISFIFSFSTCKAMNEYEFILMVGLIYISRLSLREDKLTSTVDKPFEGISKAVCECISHSRLDNVNGYRTDEDFLWTDGLAIRRLKILACTKTRNNVMKRPNWISTVKALYMYEHCISIEISELPVSLFVDWNIGKVLWRRVWCKGKLPEVRLP